MPSDDLILSLKQIAGYPAVGSAYPSDAILIQRGGLGGPYQYIGAEALVATALAQGGTLTAGSVTVSGTLTADTVLANLMDVKLLNAQTLNATTASIDTLYGQIGDFSQAVYIGGAVAATTADIANANAVIRNSSVWSFDGRVGDVWMNSSDLAAAGGAPLLSPVFQGAPMAPTPSLSSNNNSIATTAFVTATTVMYINNLLETHPFVFTFNGRSGDVVVQASDILGAAPLDSPAFTGNPTAPTPLAGDNSQSLATTAFVAAALVTNTNSILSTVSGLYAPINSPVLTGNPTAPTAAPGTNTGQLATTAYVHAAVTASTTGVASFNTRTGAVSLEAADVTNAGGALLASPVFTGTPQAPTAGAGVATNQIATCAWVLNEIGGATTGVMSFNGRAGIVTLTSADLTSAGGALLASPTFSGTPTAPTATTGTANTQIATTAFVQGAIAAGGVTSFNGRNGAVTLTSNDVSAAGGAVLASPAFTGVPTAPTAGLGTSTTQLATTAFVAAALAATGGVSTWNGRAGTVTMTAADITAAGGAPIASPTFTGVVTIPVGAQISGYAPLASPAFSGSPTAPTATSGTNTTQLATTAYVMARAALYLPLAGGTVTGQTTFSLGPIFQTGIKFYGPANPATILWLDQTSTPRSVYGQFDGVSYPLVYGLSSAQWISPIYFGIYQDETYISCAFIGGGVTWSTTPSDRAVKSGIRAAGDALAVIGRVGVHELDYTPGRGMSTHWKFSLIADEVDAELPEAVIHPPEGRASLHPTLLIAALWRAVQQLSAKVSQLEGARA